MFSTIQLTKKNQIPLYLQLANGLSVFIRNGHIPPGTKLPAIRSLAKELKINRDTVVAAYKVLEQRNLVYGQIGRGTFVSSIPLSIDPSCPNNNKSLINFATISLPTEYYPIEQFDYIASCQLSKEGWNAFHDISGGKYQNFKQNICTYLHSLNIRSTPKQIRVIQNISELFYFLSNIFSKPGICIESPSKTNPTLYQYGFKVFPISLENDGLNLEQVEQHLKTSSIQYIHIMPYLQNPTGICYSAEKISRLIELAYKYNVYIIIEDSYSDLLLDPSIGNRSNWSNDRMILVTNFSKIYLPTLSYSFLSLPRPLADIIPDHYVYNFTDSLFNYYLENKLWVKNSSYLIDTYKKKYIKMLGLIDTYLSPYISYTNSLGGLYIWLTLNLPSLTIETLCNQLLNESIVVSPGSLFYIHNKNNVPNLRISIASVSMEQLEKGIAIFSTVLKKNYPKTN